MVQILNFFKKNKWKHGEFRIIKWEVFEKGGVAFFKCCRKIF